jgi:uncharacterized repeat protein (TIGR01451 family)
MPGVFAWVLLIGMTVLGASDRAHAIAPDTPIVNTANVDYNVGGAALAGQAQSTVVSASAAGNQPPTDILLSDSEFPGDTPGATVGTLSSTDPNAGDTHSYEVDDPRFEVVGDQLRLRDGESLAPGTTVTVTVTTTDNGGLSYGEPFVLTATPPGGGSGDGASVTFYQRAPGDPAAEAPDIATASCMAGGTFELLPAPATLRDGPLAVPGSLPLAPASVLKAGEPALIEVLDPSANADPAIREQLEFTVSTDSGDLESLLATETAIDSGRFFAYIETVSGTPVAGDCRLSVGTSTTLQALYIDAADSADRAVAAVLVDPLGVVFDSATGQPVDGTRVTLLDATTGQPAAVFGDDGVATYPSTVVTGAPVTDGAGQLYAGSPGAFRFPFVAPGEYRLQIEPPNRFRFPSTVDDATLQTLPGAPRALSDASRGATFVVPVGPAVRVDVPLDVLPVQPTRAQLVTQRLDPASPDAVDLPVAPGQCLAGNGPLPAPPAQTLAGGALALPDALSLAAASRFQRGDVLFLTVTDLDQDLDPFAPDLLTVRVALTESEDREQVQLTETGASTGIFTGYLQTRAEDAGAVDDCVLAGPAGSAVELTYIDPDDASDLVRAEAQLDPAFRLFSSVNGALVDGLTVTLVDALTNAPAVGRVFAADGSTPFPATVVAGGTVTDGNGVVVRFASGSFRFPVIAPGRYRLLIETGAAYRYPSLADASALGALPGGPFELRGGSRSDPFEVVAGTAPGFDVPLDPLTGALSLVKEVSRETAAIGDFLQYRITVRNGDGGAAVDAAILEDQLPRGLRLVPGSARFDDGEAAALQADGTGRGLRLPLAPLPPGAQRSLRYVVEVAAGTPQGSARNRVRLLGAGTEGANEAFADVEIRDDLITRDTFILGRVTVGDCEDFRRNPGQPDVRVHLEDGRFAVTDAEGKYHFEGVRPGTHVVQVDEITVPRGYELVACDADSRAAGKARSRFVDVAEGSLWRADFQLQQIESAAAALTGRLRAKAADGLVSYRLDVEAGAAPLAGVRATVMLSDHLVLAPGSVTIDGKAAPDPEGVALGALTFRLPERPEGFQTRIRFDTLVTNASAELLTRAAISGRLDGAAVRVPVLSNRLSLDWPESLIEIARDRLRLAYPDRPEERAQPAAAPLTDRAAPERPAPAGNGKSKGQSSDNDVMSAAPLALRAGVYEPSGDGIHADSGLARLPLATAMPEATAPYQIPEIAEVPPPAFDRAWLATQDPGFELVWPPEEFNPRIPSIAVAVKHRPGDRPLLQVDGALVNSLAFEGTVSDRKRGVAVSYWQNVPISETDSVLRATSGDLSRERTVHFGSAPIDVELVPEESWLIADGVTPPMLAVRLYDRAGRPARPGLTGEYGLAAPYAPFEDNRALRALRGPEGRGQGLNRYRVRQDGIAYIQLEPTTVAGEVVLNFEFDALRQQTLRAMLTPGQREWILVGVVEGVLGLNDRGGNRDAIDRSDLADSTLTDGRVALYAKGTVRGDWLVTAAYDTDKETQRRLRQQIDPNRFYTLYGDGSEQRFDAESQRKLYLKVERSQFSALFGDYETPLDRTEFTRYARSLNGLSAQYRGEKLRVDAFGSETGQGFVRDELPGDGTSGIYRLSRQRLVINSEQVSILTRDRFRQDQERSRKALVRYLDYTIDYDRGTLIFKQPVFSQDFELNPVFIEVTYEVEPNASGNDLLAGGRVAWRLDDEDSEAALTYVYDDSLGSDAQLYGADLNWEFLPGTRVRAELAQTQTRLGTGDAYLFELEQQTAALAGTIFFREQDARFGIGQQSAFSGALRSFGATGEYRLSERWLLRGEAFEQRDLSSGGRRQVVSGEGEFQDGNQRYRAGLRSVRESLPGGAQRRGDQLLGGVSRRLMNNRLTLRGDAEVGIGGGSEAADYPTRAIFGAELDLVSGITLIGEQEFTFADERDTQDTRVGLRMRPWPGADFNTSLERELTENGQRVFATTGLVQQWRLNDDWFFDFGADRVQTIRRSGDSTATPLATFRPINQPASGSVQEDFTAFFTGVGYRRDDWDVSSRLEWHLGERSDKWNWLLGANRQQSDGRIVSASLSVLNEDLTDGGRQDSADLRLGYAFRPTTSNWLLLNRLDLSASAQENLSFDVRSRKVVNNFHANYRDEGANQLSLQLGLKYVQDQFDGERFSGVTGLAGAEYRRDLGQRFDFGARMAALKSFDAGTMRYSAGVSVGVSPFADSWFTLGYNFVGFSDEDFADAEFTAKGPYLKLRLRLDQDLIRRFTSPVAPDKPLR